MATGSKNTRVVSISFDKDLWRRVEGYLRKRRNSHGPQSRSQLVQEAVRRHLKLMEDWQRP